MFQIPEEFGAPRQIVFSEDTLIVGTTRNAIVKGSFDGDFEAVSQVIKDIYLLKSMIYSYYYISTLSLLIIQKNSL